MTYKAIIDISTYKTGDVVPEEKALLWNGMYAVPPCERVEDKPVKEKK